MSDLFDECRVVRAGAEPDETTAPAFARDLEAARRSGCPPFLVVDPRGGTFGPRDAWRGSPAGIAVPRGTESGPWQNRAP